MFLLLRWPGTDRPGRRTLTVYTDLWRLTGPLAITHRSTIWLYLTARGAGLGGCQADSGDRADCGGPSRQCRQRPREVEVECGHGA